MKTARPFPLAACSLLCLALLALGGLGAAAFAGALRETAAYGARLAQLAAVPAPPSGAAPLPTAAPASAAADPPGSVAARLRAGLAHAAAPPAVDTAAAAARSVVTPAATAATAPAAAAGGSLSAVFTPEVQQWAADILRWAAAYQLDPNLIATLMQVESCGDPQAHSGAGAQGLFQVMPHHFSRGENMWDPDTNARRGLAYFNRGLRVHQGDVFRSFAGYNAGHATAAQPWATWPRETQQFHYWTSGIYVAARAGQAHSDVLQAWLRAGGADLCRQAADRLGW